MAVLPNGNLLALGFGRPRSPDAGIILWDLNAKAYRRKVVGHRPFAIAFSPDGRTLVSTSERHDVVFWDVATGLQLRNLGGHRNTVTGAAFSRDGTKLATTDFSGNLRIRNAAPLAEIDHHPLTLRSLLNLGVVQNQERNYSTAEMTLCHLFARQKELGDREMSATRTEITTALEGQGKLPAIARHPESAKVHLGEQVTLRVEVSGDGPWSFQWFRNGHRIDGATEQELLLTVASNTDFGSYHVAVRPFGRDDVNPVVSNWAHVTERAAPVHPPPRSGEP